MDAALAGKRLLVTGGTRGVGRATVLAAAGAGARVVTCYHHDEAAAAALAARLGPGHRVVKADLTRPEDAARLAAECRTELGGLDALVNNAGVDGHGRLEELDDGEWSRVLGLDLTAVFVLTQACLHLLGPGSAIVNVAASAALRGVPGRSHYTAAKAGVLGLTRSLCKELGPRRVRVNAVAPGVLESDGDPLPPPVAERVARMTALGRLGRPEEVAAAVLYLAGDLAGYLTGATLTVDGGI
ncbi:SDR family NAD(P)-dependent oxidoreductase [Sphaerisporangium dianthi]|uniref:SDR family NAD(P)-dependent oxidoreductase n=1 Tax=Sphaerisporangium dianthi TaxID=1436120 RepID=A0ABV9CL24_9ACTN